MGSRRISATLVLFAAIFASLFAALTAEAGG